MKEKDEKGRRKKEEKKKEKKRKKKEGILRSQEIVDVERLNRLVFHVDVPDLEGQVVARENVTSIAAELDVGN